ncbi:hypothetical protein P9209_05175 [Prescottella defluvii]|nr:hypothetical protein P9209_05175 [Prescottella defluvii]
MVAVALLAGALAASQVGKVIVALPAVRDDLGMSLTASVVLLSSYTFVGALLGSAARCVAGSGTRRASSRAAGRRAGQARLTALVVLGNIVGNIASGLLLHRGVRPGTLVAVAATAMGAAAVVVYADWAPFAFSYSAAVAFALVGGLLPAAVFAAVPGVAHGPREVGPVNGLVVQMSNVGSIVGPPSVAFVATHVGGWSVSPLVLSATAAVCLVSGLALRARVSR